MRLIMVLIGISLIASGCTFPARNLLTNMPGVSTPMKAEGHWTGMAVPTDTVPVPYDKSKERNCKKEILSVIVAGLETSASMVRPDGRVLSFYGSAAAGSPLTDINHGILYLKTNSYKDEGGMITFVPGDPPDEMVGQYWYRLGERACSGHVTLKRGKKAFGA